MGDRIRTHVICEHVHLTVPEKTFATFVVDDANHLAYIAALAVAESPGAAYNPFVIFGPAGIGKSHLVLAISHHIETQHPQLRARSVEHLTATYPPHRVLLQRPVNEDLLVISERAGHTHSGFNTDEGLLFERRQQIVMTCRTHSQARAVLQASGLLDRGMIAGIHRPLRLHGREGACAYGG